MWAESSCGPGSQTQFDHLLDNLGMGSSNCKVTWKHCGSARGLYLDHAMLSRLYSEPLQTCVVRFALLLQTVNSSMANEQRQDALAGHAETLL